MAISQIRTAAKPQLIPTNAGFRTFAAPPAALQEDIVPNDLFYIRNHWREVPKIDVASYQLVVDGSGPRSVAMGPSIGGRLVRIFVGSIVLGVLLIGGGAVLMIVGALRQNRARNRTYDRPAPSSWSTGEWQQTGPRGPAQ